MSNQLLSKAQATEKIADFLDRKAKFVKNDLNPKKANQRVHFRYSRVQRRRELKVSHYRDIRECDKKRTVINGKTVKGWEAELSKYNLNTSIYKNWIEVLKQKSIVSNMISLYYKSEIYRKLKWYSYLNQKRSEDKMLNNFQLMFGPPTETAIIFGDFSSNKTLKNQEPTKGKSIRRLFQKRGYKLYLVDEYNTSAKMYETGTSMERFKMSKNPRPFRKGKRLVHGLIRTKSEKGKSSLTNSDSHTILMNRDMNGALNILYKGRSIIEGKEIPKYMDRKKQENKKEKEQMETVIEEKSEDIQIIKEEESEDEDIKIPSVKRKRSISKNKKGKNVR